MGTRYVLAEQASTSCRIQFEQLRATFGYIRSLFEDVPGILSAKTSVPEARFDLERHSGIFEAKVNRRHAISGPRCCG